MDVTPHVARLQEDLTAAAALADEATAQIARRLGRALEAPFALRLLEAIGEAADELSSQLEHARIDVRLSGGELQLSVLQDAPLAESGPVESAGDDQDVVRLTLRMPVSLKEAVELAASREGASVNTWLVGAVRRALSGDPPRPPLSSTPGGRRLTGYGSA